MGHDVGKGKVMNIGERDLGVIVDSSLKVFTECSAAVEKGKTRRPA